jgi:hypothetical protein
MRPFPATKQAQPLLQESAQAALIARRVKDRMNGTAGKSASISNSADGVICPEEVGFRVFAALVEWRAALEGICSSGTLKDTE